MFERGAPPAPSPSAAGLGPGAGPAAGPPAWQLGLAALSLVAAGLVAFHNSLHGPFLFDDDPAIFNNPTIRHLWPPWGLFRPPNTGAPVTSRPLVNVSFAINYALGGLHVEGYHIFNLAAHLGVALLLFGLVRRTLALPSLGPRLNQAALPLAWLGTLIWVVHPLVTEPVTYIVGRTEVLMAACYLATLYAALRAAQADRPFAWRAAAVAACAAGMACKEVMVSVPLVALLYDRTFLAGSFRDAWQRRGSFYLVLASTWLVLAAAMLEGGWGSRGGSTGFGGRITPLEYLITQTYALTRYLRLSVWPHPLILDYGTYLATDPGVFIPCGLLVLALLAATAYALWRRPAAGFLGAWFFVILAPSSSFVPVITQTIAERRMYLALPAVVLIIVLGFYHLVRRGAIFVGAVVALGLIPLTVQRNHDYRSAAAAWEDTIAKWPNDPRPHLNLGLVLMEDPNKLAEATAQFREAIRIDPHTTLIYCLLGSCLSLLPGHDVEAERAFRTELKLEPHSALGHLNYGLFLSKLPGREAEAERELRGGLGMKTEDASIRAQAHAIYGEMLVKLPGRHAAGEAELRESIRLFPDLADPHAYLGLALAQDGDVAAGIRELDQALALKPNSAEIHSQLATLLAQSPGRTADAVAEYETAIRLNPYLWSTHYNVASLLRSLPQRAAEAVPHLEAAARLAPDNGDVRTSLALALAALPDRGDEALREFAAAARLRPGSEDTHFNYGVALAKIPNLQDQAAAEFRTASKLNPTDPEAHYQLACVLAGIEGQSYAAIREFQTTLQLKPDHPGAHLDIALILQSVPARRPEAIQHLQLELQQHPDDQDARDLLAKFRAGGS